MRPQCSHICVFKYMRKINFQSVSRFCPSCILILLCVVSNVRLLHGHIDINQRISAEHENYGVNGTAFGSGKNNHVDGFPRIPICKWASLSNFYITHSRNEGRPEWRELMEMIDDADELSGDISRPGASELMLREAVVHFSQVMLACP